MQRAIPLIVAASLLLAACAGGADQTPPAGGASTPTPAPGAATAAPGSGSLPESGALVRVVNLYADDSGPQAIDAYGFAGTEIVSEQVLVGSVPYGEVSDWFNPGFVEGSSGSRTVSLAIRLQGAEEQLIGASDTSIVPGSRATFIVSPSDSFGPRIRVALDSHPDTERADVPKAPDGAALLATSYEGLPPGDFATQVFYGSVGNYCLRGKFPDPEIEAIVGHPLGQPIGNELVVEPGTYTLTIHRASDEPGAIETCQSSPVAEAPLQIAAGDIARVFLHAPLGQSTIEALVVPFEP